MIRIFIEPTTFEILSMQYGQNPYIIHTYESRDKLHKAKVQHGQMIRAFTATPVIQTKLPKKTVHLPDIVFISNAGMSLPRLNYPLFILSNMKYPQRQAELPYLKKIFDDIKLPYIEYPGKEVFEGQAEVKWFHGGTKAICGYGHRSTKKTFEELDHFFEKIYGRANKPELLPVHLASPDFYHLDIALLEYDDSKCIVQRNAFSAKTIRSIQDFLGYNNVTIIDTVDTMCLNAVVDGAHIITHKLEDPTLKPLFESLLNRSVKEVNTSEFERSGGSVRCMTLDIYMI